MNDEQKFPYVVNLAAESVISPLPEPLKKQIRRGVDVTTNAASGTGTLLLQASYAVSYNRNSDDLHDLDLPDELIAEIDVQGGLPSGQQRFGTMASNVVVLNYQENINSDSGFLLIVSFADFDYLVGQLFPDSGLTATEVRLVMQIVCGYTLREAAVADNVSYETKRTQYKSISSKTGMPRQSDLAVFVTARLSLELRSGFYTASRGIQSTFEVHKQVMHPSVQLHVSADSDGAMHRIMDMGPRNGKPYLVLHGTALPMLTDRDSEFLIDNSMRLLWPLRRGLMEPNETVGDIDSFCLLYSRSILMALDVVADPTTPVDVISVGSGCSHAIDLYKSQPQRVKSISFVTACYRPGSEVNAVNRVAQGLDKLAAYSPGMLAIVFKMMRRHLQKESAFAKYMRGVSEGSEPDTRIVEYELSDPDRLRNFQTRILSSVEFFVFDHRTRINTDWACLKDCDSPVTFFHGTMDAFYPLPGIEKLAADCAKPVVAMPDTGHFIYMEHFTKALSLIIEKHQHNGPDQRRGRGSIG
jgi:pimeloyl-ACP methyl ester carboxylesterase/DNA-binding CsgD family transcriptional regulator